MAKSQNVKKSSEVSPKRIQLSRDQLLYYVIAAVNVIIISASLFLTHSLNKVLSESIATHDEWVKRSEGYERLAEAIADLDVPGNAVFESMTVEKAETSLTVSTESYEKALAKVRESTMGFRSLEQENLVLQDLEAVDHSVTEMIRISRSIFSDLHHAQKDDAIRIMAEMDRAYGDAGKMITMLRRHVWLFEQSDLQLQQSHANLFDVIARWFSVFVLLIVSAATAYSRLMARKLEESQKIIEVQQAQIQASSRMSALGEMAAGVTELEDNVEIVFTDNGSGVPVPLREKIMNPFFTTKEVGRGTGLGLSISTGIAQAHGGTLTLDTDSQVTRFVVSLPKETPVEVREMQRAASATAVALQRAA